MRALLKALFALWLGLLAVQPLFSDDGGGGGGGGPGVWILPNSSCLTNRGNNNTPLSMARAQRTYTDLSKDIVLELPCEMVDPLATMIVPMTNQRTNLRIEDRILRLSGCLLTNLVEAGVPQIEIVVVDDNNRGFRVLVLFDLVARSATLYVF
jgi:hypothetical protein